MSRPGDVWDSSAMESLSSLNIERVNRRVYATREEAKAVFDHVERFYSPRRRHSTLEYQNPVEHENAVCPAWDGVEGSGAIPMPSKQNTDASEPVYERIGVRVECHDARVEALLKLGWTRRVDTVPLWQWRGTPRFLHDRRPR